jgi:hypothetical protein
MPLCPNMLPVAAAGGDQLPGLHHRVWESTDSKPSGEPERVSGFSSYSARCQGFPAESLLLSCALLVQHSG